MLEEEALSEDGTANGNGDAPKKKWGAPKGRKNPRAGNRSLLTPTFLKRVEDLAAQGMTQVQIATILNVNACTVSSWKSRDGKLEDKFRKALEKGQARGIQRRMKRIEKAGMKGSWQADAWLLERRNPEQFARRDMVRVSDADGNALPAATTTVIAPTVVFVQPGKEEMTNITDVQQITNGNGNGGGH
jgi:IS30 family transposase